MMAALVVLYDAVLASVVEKEASMMAAIADLSMDSESVVSSSVVSHCDVRHLPNSLSLTSAMFDLSRDRHRMISITETIYRSELQKKISITYSLHSVHCFIVFGCRSMIE